MNAHNVIVIDANDWDREQVIGHLKSLSRPVRLIDITEMDDGDARPDVIILGVSDELSLRTARAHLATARERSPQAQLILCAPRDLPGLDARVLELKARAFLLKPIEKSTFEHLLEETLGQIRLRQERAQYSKTSRSASEITEIVGSGAEISAVLTLLERVASSSTTSVLFLGETGVGKTLFAKTVHELCETTNGPFIEINCASLPTSLLESELFGYEPGAFTDARGQKSGLIELAHRGTLFLDEITELDILTQAKLLKFLDTKRFRRLGGETEISVETRIVAASNRNIRAEVAAGNFREDLYYRLNVVEIHIPSLRDRREDITTIANHYLDVFTKRFKKTNVELTPAAWDLIETYHWPGNVRELINVLERAVLLSPDEPIGPGQLPIDRRSARRQSSVRKIDGEIEVTIPEDGVSLESLEKAAIVAALKRTRGNVSRAADLLCISRGALRNKIARHTIDVGPFHRPAAVEV